MLFGFVNSRFKDCYGMLLVVSPLYVIHGRDIMDSMMQNILSNPMIEGRMSYVFI